MKGRRKKNEFWFPKGPFSSRHTRGRWRRLHATYTEGELRSRFEDYQGPLKENQRESFAGSWRTVRASLSDKATQPQDMASIRPTIH
jgi:hypothetical protein